VKYNIAPKPTYYDGIRFRSRLEATWAAFFDLCRWRWEYEPLDLKGWVPDFVLHGPEPIAVEVKPVMTFADFPQSGFDKMNASGWVGRILIVGTGISTSDQKPSIGWLADNRLQVDGPRADWLPCRFASFATGDCDIDLATETKPRGLIFDGEFLVSHQSPTVIKRLWNLASNKTAWRR